LCNFFKLNVSDYIERFIDYLMLIQAFQSDWHWGETKFFVKTHLKVIFIIVQCLWSLN